MDKLYIFHNFIVSLEITASLSLIAVLDSVSYCKKKKKRFLTKISPGWQKIYLSN